MRMNHRVVLFLMVCNATSADSVIVPGSIDFSHYMAAEALSNHYI